MTLRTFALTSMFALATLALAIGCDSKKDDPAPAGETAETPEKPATKPATSGPLAGFDVAAEMARLEGKWHVKTRFGQKTPTVWTVKNGKVTAVDGEKTITGKLKMDFPGRIAVVTEENGGSTSSYYSFTHNDGTIYLGLGKGGVKIGDVYYAADSKGFARFDGKSCQFHEQKMSFGSKPITYKAPADIVCKVEGTTFSYQVPGFGKDAGFEDKTLEIVGTALLNDQLKNNVISKAE